MTVRTRPATADDFRRFVGGDPPPIWLGLVAEENGEIVGAGVVFWDELGRAWGSYSARRALPPVTMHRAARRVLAALEAVGEPALYTFCSRTIVGAQKWLRRLGFKPLPELTTDPNHPVWVCTILN
jgi:hypothetical protein